MNTELAARPKHIPLALRRSWLLDDPTASISEGIEQNGHATAGPVTTTAKRWTRKPCVRHNRRYISTTPLPGVAGFEVFLGGRFWVFGDKQVESKHGSEIGQRPACLGEVVQPFQQEHRY